MNMKKLILATSLGLISIAGSATPVPTSLNDLSGNVTVHLSGVTTDATNLWTGTNETTWGLGSITQILGTTTNEIYNPGVGGNVYLYFMLYGVADQSVTNYGPFTQVNSVGATGGVADGFIHLDIYTSNADIPSLDTTFDANPSSRTGYGTDSLLAGLGPAYLNLDLVPGVDPTNPLVSLQQVLSGTQDPVSGQGAFYANVVGGTGMAQWDTSSQHGGTDLRGTFTVNGNGNFDPYNNGDCTLSQISLGQCFPEFVNDPIVGEKIPEPASLAMIGLGLAALARLRRRKN